jgi:hypothetical protein
LGWPDALGAAGAALIVLAYFLNQQRRLASDDWRYPATNLAGALLILVSLRYEPNLPSILIEAFWVAISLYGIARSLRGRTRR